MAKKVILKDLKGTEVLPITRGELVIDSSGKLALHSNEFLATTSLPGLMSATDKNKLDNFQGDTYELSGVISDDKYITTLTSSRGVTTNTVIEPMQGATVDLAGKVGLVPAPLAGYQNKFLSGDGTWKSPEGTSITAEDILEKLKTVDGVDSGLDADLLDGLQPSELYVAGINQVYQENINFKVGHKKLQIISPKVADALDNGFPSGYSSGLSVISNYVGWQMVTYGGSSINNPYFRKLNDTDVWSDWKQLAFITDNVASATKLQTARTIWGQTFDGTANVSGNLTIGDGYLILNGNKSILALDAKGNNAELIRMNSNPDLVIGTGIANTGYGGTYIRGGAIVLQYGSSYTNGLILNSAGNVLIGTATDSGYKLDVNGKVNITSQGDGAELLRFNTERPWVFRQKSTGGSSALELHSSGADKIFYITSDNNDVISELFCSANNASYLKYKGDIFPSGGSLFNLGRELSRWKASYVDNSIVTYDVTLGRTLNVNGINISKLQDGVLYIEGNVTSTGFIKEGYNDTSVLLAGGGSKLLSDFAYKTDLNDFVTGGPYLPLTGGTLSGDLYFNHTTSSVPGYIEWSNGSRKERLKVTDLSSVSEVFTFQLSTDSGSTYTDLCTITTNGIEASNVGVNAVYRIGTGTGRHMLWYDTDRVLVGSADSSTTKSLHFRSPTGNATISTSTSATNTILHSGNSSVTKSGQTLTVTINGTSQSLTNSTYNFSGTSFTSGNKDAAEHDANNITSNGVWYYTANGPATSLGASTNDGALYSQAYNPSWVGQIAQDYRNGNLFTRGRNSGTWTAWKRVAYTDGTVATANNGIFYIAGTGTTAGTWLGSHSGITSYYTGLTIAYKIPIAGASTTTLNINSLGAKTCYINTSKLTTHYGVGSVAILVYDGTYFRAADYWDGNNYAYVRLYITDSTNTNYPLLFRYNTDTPETYVTLYTRYDSAITVNPSTNTITATTFKGTATLVSCNATTDNITRPIVLTDTSNKLWYTTKATINYSTGNITATTFTGTLTNTLTFSAGTFAAKTYNNSAAVTINIPTKTSHLTNDSNFFTVTAISKNTDINTLKGTTLYYIDTDSNAGTLTNAPYTKSFAMLLLKGYESGDDLRRYRLAIDGYGAARLFNDRDTANTGGSWVDILTSKNSGISGDGGNTWGSSVTIKINGVEKTLTIPANPNVDTKVTLTNTTGSANYRVLFSATADDTTRAEGARKSTKLLFNPSSGLLTATGFVKSGSSDSYVLLGGGGHKALSDFAMASAYVKKAGDTMTGTLTMSGISTSNWTEGIRINDATNGWTTLTMGGTATSGTGANIWSLHTYLGNFYIAKNGSSTGDQYINNVNNCWRINTTYGSDTLNVGGWVTTIGDTGWYNYNYDGGIYMTDSYWIRTYGGKSFYCDKVIYAGGVLLTASATFLQYVQYTNLDVLGFGWDSSYGDYLWFKIPGTNNQSIHMRLAHAGGLYIWGSSYAYHFYEHSDIRYKKVLNPLKITLEQLSSIPLFDFEWIDRDNGIHTGSSAQAVKEILPNLVSSEGEKLTLDYGVLGTVAGITACRELTEHELKIQKLQNRISELEEKIENFKNKN